MLGAYGPYEETSERLRFHDLTLDMRFNPPAQSCKVVAVRHAKSALISSLNGLATAPRCAALVQNLSSSPRFRSEHGRACSTSHAKPCKSTWPRLAWCAQHNSNRAGGLAAWRRPDCSDPALGIGLKRRLCRSLPHAAVYQLARWASWVSFRNALSPAKALKSGMSASLRRLAPLLRSSLRRSTRRTSSWELGGKDRTTQGACSAEEETCRTLSVVCVRPVNVTASRDETRRGGEAVHPAV